MAAALVLVSPAAVAQSEAPLGEGSPDVTFPHGRASFGAFVGGSSFYNGNYRWNVDILGAYLRAGLQLTRVLGAEVEVAGGTSAFTLSAHGAFFVDLTPTDWITFGLGPVVGANYGHGACAGSSLDPCAVVTGTVTPYVAGAGRVDFFPRLNVSGSGARGGVDLGLELQVGAATGVIPSNEARHGLASYFMVGYSFY